jgi:hypothetical protein
MRIMDSDSDPVKMAEASGVVELEDEEVLQFIERSEAANTMGKTRSDLNTW